MNDTDKCSGTTTWSRRSQKSTIDFLLVNNAAYNICSRMQIDEKQEKFDLSDHNLIETTLKMDCDHINYQRRGEWENIEYYKTDEQSIHSFITELEDNLGKEDNLIPMEDLNMMIRQVADDKLKTTYRRRLITSEHYITKEKPWVTDEIRDAIKRRKELNRAKRIYKDEEERKMKFNLYLAQKSKARAMIKEEMEKHEMKVAKNIRHDKSRGKKIWDNIDKLRGKMKTNSKY